MGTDLSICCWDSANGGARMMEPEGQKERSGLDYVDGPIRIAWDNEDTSFQAYRAEDRLALFWVPDSGTLAAWEQGAPFRRIFHWWSVGVGLQLLHGAAVGTDAGGVMLVGKSGSGKSTTALACVGSSLKYLSDDYCLVENGTTPRVHSLYGSGKGDASAIARLPRLAQAFISTPIDQQGKAIIFIWEHFPQAISRSFPLRALVVPRITMGTASSSQILSRGEALRALAPSTLFQMPGDRSTSLAHMTALIRKLPCWQLDIGSEPDAAQPLIEEIIASGTSKT